MQYPRFGNLLADLLVEKLQEAAIKPDIVVGPALGAVHWELFVASALERRASRTLDDYFLSPASLAKVTTKDSIDEMIKAAFAERASGSDEFAIRRGIELKEGARVLIVEDVTTTGGSARKVVELVKSLGATPVAVGAIVDRSGGSASFDVPFLSLLKLNLTTYDPADCPLCKSGSTPEKPGSSKK
jgi:orotate phosphoribosyltransferase